MINDGFLPPPPSPASSISVASRLALSYSVPSVPATASAGLSMKTQSHTGTNKATPAGLVRPALAAFATWLADTGLVSEARAADLVCLAEDDTIADPEASVHQAILSLLAENGGSDCRALAHWVLDRWLHQRGASLCSQRDLPSLEMPPTVASTSSVTATTVHSSSGVKDTWQQRAGARWLAGSLTEAVKHPMRAALDALRQSDLPAGRARASRQSCPTQRCARSTQPAHTSVSSPADSCPLQHLRGRRPGSPTSPHFGLWTPVAPTWWDTGPEEERAWLDDAQHRSTGYIAATDIELAAENGSPYCGSIADMVSPLAQPRSPIRQPPSPVTQPLQTATAIESPQVQQRGDDTATEDATEGSIPWLMQHWAMMKQRRRNDPSMSPQPSPCSQRVSSPSSNLHTQALDSRSPSPHAANGIQRRRRCSEPSRLNRLRYMAAVPTQAVPPSGTSATCQGSEGDMAVMPVPATSSHRHTMRCTTQVQPEGQHTPQLEGQQVMRAASVGRYVGGSMPKAASYTASSACIHQAPQRHQNDSATCPSSRPTSPTLPRMARSSTLLGAVALSGPSAGPSARLHARYMAPPGAPTGAVMRLRSSPAVVQEAPAPQLRVQAANSSSVQYYTKAQAANRESSIHRATQTSISLDATQLSTEPYFFLRPAEAVVSPCSRCGGSGCWEGCPNSPPTSLDCFDDCSSLTSTRSSLRGMQRMGSSSSSCEVFFIGTPRCG